MKTEEPKVTEKTFCEVIDYLLSDNETKEIYDKTFGEKECQLKK